MSVKKSVVRSIDHLIEARKYEISKLARLKGLVVAGKAYYRAKLFGMWTSSNIITLESQARKTAKKAINDVIDWYRSSTIDQWPPRSNKPIKQGDCGARIHLFAVDPDSDLNSQRIYDEKLWWHHVESAFQRIWRTQPTRRRRA